jgi:hypothetical protein
MISALASHEFELLLLGPSANGDAHEHGVINTSRRCLEFKVRDSTERDVLNARVVD